MKGLQEPLSRAEVKIWNSRGCNKQQSPRGPSRRGLRGRGERPSRLPFWGGSCLARGKKIQLGVRGHVFDSFISQQLLSVFPVLRFSGEEKR